MKLNNPPTITGSEAIYTVEEWDLLTYHDMINLRTLPIYQVQGRDIIFPAQHLDEFIVDHTLNLPLELNPELFDYQQVMAKVGWLKERYAYFADAGLGKTFVFGELIRQIHASTDERIIVCVPLNIMRQFEEMITSFFPDFPEFEHLHGSKMTLKEWCHWGDTRVAFVNHEFFIKDQELPNVCAFFLDESSILKGGIGGNGKIARNLIRATKGIRYKFAGSATPSPNDRTEYAMHALFLEIVRSEKEFYAMFFVNKNDGYVLRRHAEEAFYAYLAHFSMFIRSPKAYGFEDNLAGLLPWKELFERVDVTPEQLEYFQQYANRDKQRILPGLATKPGGMTERGKFSQISKGFIYRDDKTTLITSNKPKAITDIVQEHSPEQVIIWTVFDAEGDIIYDRLCELGINAAHITGKTKEDKRIEYIEQFRHGELRVIVSKPRILGFGLNFQNCRIAIYSGLSDSYEMYYQSVKRIHRYGQTKQVLIYHVITDYEEAILQNVLNKKKQNEQDFAYQERLYIKSLYDELRYFIDMEDHRPMEKQEIVFEPIRTDDYEIYHADSIEAMLKVRKDGVWNSLHKNSVDFSVFSPPFMGDIFTYSSDPADMGNTRGAGAEGGLDEFMMQFHFFLEGMLTVTKPGRLMAIHLEQVPLRKGLDGNVGFFDFRGSAIAEASKVGWIPFGEVCILKNQQMQAIVKHISTLTMGNMWKDRARITPAFNGYLVFFKKPGENEVPIKSTLKCECGWIGKYEEAEIVTYESIESDAIRAPIQRAAYANPEIGRNHPYCPNCNTILKQGDMYGDKWVMYAEGAWPESGMDDYDKVSKLPQEARWQDLVQQALGVWYDVSESDTLQAMHKDDEDADKHLCPLPLSIARRAIELYTLPGELVFTPFLGIGTELDQAVRLGRRGVGIELKGEYFIQAGINLEIAVKESKQIDMFSMAGIEV